MSGLTSIFITTPTSVKFVETTSPEVLSARYVAGSSAPDGRAGADHADLGEVGGLGDRRLDVVDRPAGRRVRRGDDEDRLRRARPRRVVVDGDAGRRRRRRRGLVPAVEQQAVDGAGRQRTDGDGHRARGGGDEPHVRGGARPRARARSRRASASTTGGRGRRRAAIRSGSTAWPTQRPDRARRRRRRPSAVGRRAAAVAAPRRRRAPPPARSTARPRRRRRARRARSTRPDRRRRRRAALRRSPRRRPATPSSRAVRRDGRGEAHRRRRAARRPTRRPRRRRAAAPPARSSARSRPRWMTTSNVAGIVTPLSSAVSAGWARAGLPAAWWCTDSASSRSPIASTVALSRAGTSPRSVRPAERPVRRGVQPVEPSPTAAVDQRHVVAHRREQRPEAGIDHPPLDPLAEQRGEAGTVAHAVEQGDRVGDPIGREVDGATGPPRLRAARARNAPRSTAAVRACSSRGACT